jgi:hypothetical protein
VSALLAISLQLVASMGMAKHIPTRMTAMPARPTIERGTASLPGRQTANVQSAARSGASPIPGVDGATVRRAANTTFEPFLAQRPRPDSAPSSDR